MLLLKSVKRQWVHTDKNIRLNYIKYEIKKLVIKSMLYNNKTSMIHKFYFDKRFKQFPFKSSIANARTSCCFLGNNRSIFQKFKMSRHVLKNYASYGSIIGLRKSSF